jgi:hypothetical protein
LARCPFFLVISAPKTEECNHRYTYPRSGADRCFSDQPSQTAQPPRRPGHVHRAAHPPPIMPMIRPQNVDLSIDFDPPR